MSELDVQGYVAGYAVAHDNLLLGKDVVADSVNPIEITRSAWRNVGDASRAESIEIEVICSNPEEHRARYEQRVSDIPGLKYGPWSTVVDREYEAWTTADLRIDTSGRTKEESCEELMQPIGNGFPFGLLGNECMRPGLLSERRVQRPQPNPNDLSRDRKIGIQRRSAVGAERPHLARRRLILT